MPSPQDLIAVKRLLSDRLLSRAAEKGVVGKFPELNVSAATANAGANVHAVGVGRKIVDGVLTDTPCVRFYVIQKLAPSLLSPAEALPEEVDGVPTDIIESPPAFIFPNGTATPTSVTAMAASCSDARRKRQRPSPGGISAAQFEVTAGTISCYCRSTHAGDNPESVFVLSNNHVFADVNRASIGDDLFQPGPADGGTIADKFAVLHRFVPIVVDGSTPNRVDAAIGKLIEGATLDTKICSIGDINGIAQAVENMEVCKHGRTTGFTEGFCTSPGFVDTGFTLPKSASVVRTATD